MKTKVGDIVAIKPKPFILVYGKVVDISFVPPFDSDKGKQILIEVINTEPTNINPEFYSNCWGTFEYKTSPRMVDFFSKINPNWRKENYIYTPQYSLKVLNKDDRKKLIITKLSFDYELQARR